jgi:hypothetical protein
MCWLVFPFTKDEHKICVGKPSGWTIEGHRVGQLLSHEKCLSFDTTKVKRDVLFH